MEVHTFISLDLLRTETAKGVRQKEFGKESDEKSDRSIRKSDQKVTESVPKTKKSDRTPFAAFLLRHPELRTKNTVDKAERTTPLRTPNGRLANSIRMIRFRHHCQDENYSYQIEFISENSLILSPDRPCLQLAIVFSQFQVLLSCGTDYWNPKDPEKTLCSLFSPVCRCAGRRAKPGRFGSLAFAMKNRHFGGECSWVLAGKARKCGKFWVFACVPNPGKQSIWRQCPPSARKDSTKKLPNRPVFTHVQAYSGALSKSFCILKWWKQ